MTFAEEVQIAFHRAFVGAIEARHSIMTPEHLALEVIADPEIAAYLERCGADLVAVESRLRAYLSKIELLHGDAEPVPTLTFQRLVSTAAERTLADKRKIVVLRDIFLAIIDERKTIASETIIGATRDLEALEGLR